MSELIQQALNGNEIAAIVTAISPDRFKTYLTAAGHRARRASRAPSRKFLERLP
jgi:hypothetical protein